MAIQGNSIIGLLYNSRLHTSTNVGMVILVFHKRLPGEVVSENQSILVDPNSSYFWDVSSTMAIMYNQFQYNSRSGVFPP